MKKYMKYLMTGTLLTGFSFLFGSCNEDEVPSYGEMALDNNEVFIKIEGENPSAEVNILQGNGNYRVLVKDEGVAVARVEGAKVIFSGIANGETTATVMDWARKSAEVKIKVKEDFDLLLSESDLLIVKGENEGDAVDVSIRSGNGGYSVTTSDANVANAVLMENGRIRVTAGEGIGRAEVKVTDAGGMEAVLNVLVANYRFAVAEEESGLGLLQGTEGFIQVMAYNESLDIVSDNEAVAVAELVVDEGMETMADEEVVPMARIKVTPKETGLAHISITDALGMNAVVEVKVVERLSTETKSIFWIPVPVEGYDGDDAAPVIVKVNGGSGDLSISDNKGGCIKGTVNGDEVSLIGNWKACSEDFNNGKNLVYVYITDNKTGDKLEIPVNIVEQPYLSKPTRRYWIKGDNPNGKGLTAIGYDDKKAKNYMRIGDKGIFGPTYNYSVYFEGDWTVGEKTGAELRKSTSGALTNISSLRIDKVEEVDGLIWYWISFIEEGNSWRSYMVGTSE